MILTARRLPAVTVLALGFALLVPGVAHAQVADAKSKHAVRAIVRGELGAGAAFSRLDCQKKSSRVTRRVAFYVGDTSWSGNATVWRSSAAGGNDRYVFRLRREKDLCDGGNCISSVRWSRS